MSGGYEPYEDFEPEIGGVGDEPYGSARYPEGRERVTAPFGPATCLNCGDRFFPDRSPHEQFCGDICASQYTSELGL